MALIRPFRALRPEAGLAGRVAALPYDVYSREEAVQETAREPLSFLNIDRAETQFPPEVDTYDPRVYRMAGELLERQEREGIYLQDGEPHFYLYELTMDGRVQTGICACASVEDYWNGIVVKHENTREDKELDRVNHVQGCRAQTGPVFLAHRPSARLRAVRERGKEGRPLYDFTASDGIRHRVWSLPSCENGEITEGFRELGKLYIADGHHRAAAAARVCGLRRERAEGWTGEEEWNYFLSVIFDQEELRILDYNRVVRDLNGNTPEAFLERLRSIGELSPCLRDEAVPQKKGEMGVFLGDQWYCLRLSGKPLTDPVGGLDVSRLQDQVLGPILGISDPRTDGRIGFIGGIRGMEELERRVRRDCAVAFRMYPTTMEELFRVADAGLLMPPKSTWFEPKLRSGLLIHRLDERAACGENCFIQRRKKDEEQN